MDYKATLNLPKTDFQMKADLSKKEPETLKRWEDEGLYARIMEAGKDRPKYTLHDGPPYANGNIHIGHALNKILKDIIVKGRFMEGFSTDYVPGWDCHGLPIELQAEKELGQKKHELSKAEIRKRCRAYAEKFVNIQKEEFKRLGVFGQWNNPYLTMDYGYQAAILKELGRFVEKGIVYKGKKPVHWCSSCRTALAEAEVEYADKTSPSVYVKFRVKGLPKKLANEAGLQAAYKANNLYFVIWTTTPWTLPANLAIAVGKDIAYNAIEVDFDGRKEVWILATDLYEQFLDKLKMEKRKVVYSGDGGTLEGTVCSHPFIDRDSAVYVGHHVTTDAGTGCVHIAPGHGQEDYELGLKHGLDVYNPVDDNGKFTKQVPKFEGQYVFKANEGIIELLKTKEALLLREDIRHSYPHCWRCKSPIIFRATEQWFASMDNTGLRKDALEAIDKKIKWIPSWGRDRIYNMIEGRPDWCLSRQRAWGVPIPAVKCSDCNHSFIDGGMVKTLTTAFEECGADIWFERELKDLAPADLKCPKCGSDRLKKEENILDVWFDSGVSFAAVLERRPNLKFPADLYLEGSDQHRGWFHSSLLASLGTRGTPPYKAVLTHGFVVDGSGRKMSKSIGNVIAPQEVIKKYGAEVLRLWVSAEDYREDIRISEEILTRLAEAYRRIRNTFRYILGNLYDFDPDKDTVPYEQLHEIDRLTLHRLARLNETVRGAYRDFEFHRIYHTVHNFCAVDLSAFYLDVIKDRLYTSGASSKARRAGQTTIYHVLDHLVRLLAPILVFTTDEAWGFMPGKREASVHLAAMPEARKEWTENGYNIESAWESRLRLKSDASKALEAARRDKIIGHPLDAELLFSPQASIVGLGNQKEEDLLKEILIVSSLKILPVETSIEELSGNISFDSTEIPNLRIFVKKADGAKCERCWHYDPTIGATPAHPTVCSRCAEALK